MNTLIKWIVIAFACVVLYWLAKWILVITLVVVGCYLIAPLFKKP